MEIIGSRTVGSVEATPASPPRRPLPQEPQPAAAVDKVSLQKATPVPPTGKPDPPATDKPVAHSVSEPPPTTLVMEEPPSGIREDESALVLAGFRGSPLENLSVFEQVRRRLGEAHADVRAAAVLPLLDALTQPSTMDGERILHVVSGALKWARKNKQEAAALLPQEGFEGLMRRATETTSGPPATPLDQVLSSPTLLRQASVNEDEANRLLQRFQSGNPNPGLGTSALGKGVCYLRGREGTRIFFRMVENQPQWLAVVSKSEEDLTIRMLRQEFGIK